MNELEWLEKYYLSYCNGNWEHKHSINIDTLDNPGWRLDISLAGTLLEKQMFKEVEEDRSDEDWFFSLIRDKQFVGRGGPQNLRELIHIFKDWASSHSNLVFLTASEDPNELEWLENYYFSCCDGDWEHQNGAKIDSLPTPGWRFQFDLEQYILHLPPFEKVSIKRDKNDWIECFTERQSFIGTCGPQNLRELICIFKDWVESTRDV